MSGGDWKVLPGMGVEANTIVAFKSPLDGNLDIQYRECSNMGHELAEEISLTCIR